MGHGLLAGNAARWLVHQHFLRQQSTGYRANRRGNEKNNHTFSKSMPRGSNEGQTDSSARAGHRGKSGLKSFNDETPGQLSSSGVPRVLRATNRSSAFKGDKRHVTARTGKCETAHQSRSHRATMPSCSPFPRRWRRQTTCPHSGRTQIGPGELQEHDTTA